MVHNVYYFFLSGSRLNQQTLEFNDTSLYICEKCVSNDIETKVVGFPIKFDFSNPKLPLLMTKASSAIFRDHVLFQ